MFTHAALKTEIQMKNNSGSGRARTCDHYVNSVPLYQLSYEAKLKNLSIANMDAASLCQRQKVSNLPDSNCRDLYSRHGTADQRFRLVMLILSHPESFDPLAFGEHRATYRT